jgi:hypothetical protein
MTSAKYGYNMLAGAKVKTDLLKIERTRMFWINNPEIKLWVSPRT